MVDFFLSFPILFYVLIVLNFFAQSALGNLIRSAPYATNINIPIRSLLDSVYGLIATFVGFYVWYLFNWKYFLSYSLIAIGSIITYNFIVNFIPIGIRTRATDYFGQIAVFIQPVCLGVLWYLLLSI